MYELVCTNVLYSLHARHHGNCLWLDTLYNSHIQCTLRSLIYISHMQCALKISHNLYTESIKIFFHVHDYSTVHNIVWLHKKHHAEYMSVQLIQNSLRKKWMELYVCTIMINAPDATSCTVNVLTFLIFARVNFRGL